MKDRMVNRILFGLALATLLSLSTTTMAGYDIQVNAVADFLKDIIVVAVVPATCPPHANCISAEADLVEELQKYTKFAIVPPDRVRQTMLEAGMKQIDDATRVDLAERLHADTFLLPVVTESGTESQGAVGVWSGSVMTMVDSQVSKGGVQLTLIASKSGKVLMQAAGFGESEWRAKKGVLRKVFQSILTKVLGPPTK